MPLHYIEEHDFSDGFIRDLVSSLLKQGQLYDAQNLLFDKPGIARLRMGSTALVSGAQTASPTSIGFCYSADSTPIEELYGCSNAGLFIQAINKTNGAFTSIGSTSGSYPNVSRPVRHFGFLIFCGADANSQAYHCQIVAGQVAVSTFTSATAVTITAGQPQITLGGADVTTNMRVGAIVHAFNGTSNAYLGRIVSIDSATKFTVWPTPGITFTTAAADLFTAAEAIQVGADTFAYGGACATSFQNRLLFGGVNAPGDATVTRHDRRIAYSPLPTENAVSTSLPVITTNGAVFLAMNKWPPLNYIEIPGADPIVAMEPINDNQLLILTSNEPVIFSGDLITQIGTTAPTITWDESAILTPAGCLSDLSVQRTPRGIVWAGVGGVYAYRGGNTIEELTGSQATPRIAALWRELAFDAATFVIHGSAYLRNHYIVSGTSGGTPFAFAVNLVNLQWTRLTGVGTDLFYALARPTNQSQVFGLRWWNIGGAAPSMTNGQTLRLESMFKAYVAGSTTLDADGSAVTFTLSSRVISDDPSVTKFFHAGSIRYEAAMPGANITVTAQSKLNASDIVAQSVRTVGTLSNTEARTITAATNATPVVCTSNNHGLQNQDFVNVDGATGLLNMNGNWRVTVVNANSFSLNGSIGNGAYGASSASFKRVTEVDLPMNTLDSGQGVSFTIASSGTVNNFELYGLRLAVLQRPMVFSGP